MEQQDFQLKVIGSKMVSDKDRDDVLSEMMRAIENVFKNNPNFVDVQVLNVNLRDNLKMVAGGLKKAYGNFHEDDDKSSSMHFENDVPARSRKTPAHPFVSSVFQIHEPPCKNCNGELEFTIVENLNETGTDWIQWYCKSNCGYYYNVQLL